MHQASNYFTLLILSFLLVGSAIQFFSLKNGSVQYRRRKWAALFKKYSRTESWISSCSAAFSNLFLVRPKKFEFSIVATVAATQCNFWYDTWKKVTGIGFSWTALVCLEIFKYLSFHHYNVFIYFTKIIFMISYSKQGFPKRKQIVLSLTERFFG